MIVTDNFNLLATALYEQASLKITRISPSEAKDYANCNLCTTLKSNITNPDHLKVVNEILQTKLQVNQELIQVDQYSPSMLAVCFPDSFAKEASQQAYGITDNFPQFFIVQVLKLQLELT